MTEQNSCIHFSQASSYLSLSKHIEPLGINMKIFVSILAIVTIATAAATPNVKRRTGIIEMRAASDLCGPLDTPMCCATDVLGVADLSCSPGIRCFLSFYLCHKS